MNEQRPPVWSEGAALAFRAAGQWEKLAIRYRTAIENAPHADDCHGAWVEFPCDCWKADAL